MEVKLLKVENGMIQRKVHEFFTINKGMGEQLESLKEEKRSLSKNLEELAKLSKEFEEEYSRKVRKMFIEVEKKINALKEAREQLNKKDEV